MVYLTLSLDENFTCFCHLIGFDTTLWWYLLGASCAQKQCDTHGDKMEPECDAQSASTAIGKHTHILSTVDGHCNEQRRNYLVASILGFTTSGFGVYVLHLMHLLISSVGMHINHLPNHIHSSGDKVRPDARIEATNFTVACIEVGEFNVPP